MFGAPGQRVPMWGEPAIILARACVQRIRARQPHGEWWGLRAVQPSMAGAMQEDSDELTRARTVAVLRGRVCAARPVADVLMGTHALSDLGSIAGNAAGGAAGPLGGGIGICGCRRGGAVCAIGGAAATPVGG